MCEMAANAWLSIIARKGAVVVYPRTIRCQQWSDTFGMVIQNIGFDEELVEKVLIANNEKFVDPCHIVQLNSPVSLCHQFNCSHICYNLLEQPNKIAVINERQNAFTILMNSQRERLLPEKGGTQYCSYVYKEILSLHGKHKQVYY